MGGGRIVLLCNALCFYIHGSCNISVGLRERVLTSSHTTSKHKLHRSTTKQYLEGSFLLTAAGRLKPASSIPVPALNDSLLKTHSECQGPNVSVFYSDEGGVVVTEGEGCVMSGPDGEFLDAANNVAGVGHSNERVVKAGREELARIQTNGRFLHPTRSR